MTTFAYATETDISALPKTPSLAVADINNNNPITFKGKTTKTAYRFNAKSKKVINLATLDWPPYIGNSLCNKGWVFQFTVALLISKGYQVNIHFYPWARAVKLVESGVMDILFPEYFIEDSSPSDNFPDKKRRELLALSHQFPGGEISFLKHKSAADNYQGQLKNLIGENIGVVRGYQNTPEFDAMMDAGLFNIIKTIDDLQLMRMLAAKRINLIIGDPKVLYYTVNNSGLTEQNRQQILQQITPISPPLKYNYLYFAISKKRANWQQLLKEINLAITDFEQSGKTKGIIANGDKCY